MATCPVIEASQGENGTMYYTATHRGVEYCAHELCGKWFVSSRRLALGPSHIGGGKWYDTAQGVALGCKAFSGLDLLLSI
jgi:hypothetical protein